MIDDPEQLARKAAWIDELRAVCRPQRQMGLTGAAVGLAVLLFAKLQGDPLSPVGLAGISVLVASWTLLVYAIIQRTRYARAHPFNLNA